MLDWRILGDAVNTGCGIQRECQHRSGTLFDQQLRAIRACLIGKATWSPRIQPLHRTGTISPKVVSENATSIECIGIVGTTRSAWNTIGQGVVIQLHHEVAAHRWTVVVEGNLAAQIQGLVDTGKVAVTVRDACRQGQADFASQQCFFLIAVIAGRAWQIMGDFLELGQSHLPSGSIHRQREYGVANCDTRQVGRRRADDLSADLVQIDRAGGTVHAGCQRAIAPRQQIETVSLSHSAGAIGTMIGGYDEGTREASRVAIGSPAYGLCILSVQRGHRRSTEDHADTRPMVVERHFAAEVQGLVVGSGITVIISDDDRTFQANQPCTEHRFLRVIVATDAR